MGILDKLRLRKSSKGKDTKVDGSSNGIEGAVVDESAKKLLDDYNKAIAALEKVCAELANPSVSKEKKEEFKNWAEKLAEKISEMFLNDKNNVLKSYKDLFLSFNSEEKYKVVTEEGMGAFTVPDGKLVSRIADDDRGSFYNTESEKSAYVQNGKLYVRKVFNDPLKVTPMPRIDENDPDRDKKLELFFNSLGLRVEDVKFCRKENHNESVMFRKGFLPDNYEYTVLSSLNEAIYFEDPKHTSKWLIAKKFSTMYTEKAYEDYMRDLEAQCKPDSPEESGPTP